jgi:glycosyltransferase involved in cell wall biosynthesis
VTRPRLVILANNIDEVGGAQRVMHVVAQGLAERGYPVDLVGVTPFEPRHEFVADPAFRRFVLMSEPWPALPTGPAARDGARVADLRARRARLSADATAALADVLADGPAGVIVTGQLWAMEYVAKVPHDDWAVIGQYHSSFEAAAAGRDLKRALDLYRDVDAFALLTSADAESFRRQGLNNTTALANPVAFWPAEPVADGADNVVTYLGRLSVEKGAAFLVDAWGEVAERHPTWRLRLVGSGPEEAHIRSRIAALPVGSDRVEVLPPVLDSEAELSRASMVVLPSLTEGLPLVLAEAMALGLPCIATDCSDGVRMLSDDGRAARLVTRGDAGALARAISDLIDEPAERAAMGLRARVAMQPYRVERILDQWETLIADVLR